MMAHDADMQLPPGKCCGDCTRFERCRVSFGTTSHCVTCYTGPSLFKAKGSTIPGPAGFAVNDFEAIRQAAERIKAEEQPEPQPGPPILCNPFTLEELAAIAKRGPGGMIWASEISLKKPVEFLTADAAASP